MSAIPQPSALSDRILQPLREVAWRHWVARAGKGLLQVLAISLSVWLIAVILVGYFTRMPWMVRALLSAVAWGTLAYSLIHFLRPAFARRSLSSTARQVESAQADTQELISSAVELSGDVDPRYAGSQEMVAHLVKQAEVAARAVKPTQVVSYKGMRRWAIFAAPTLLAWAVLLPLWPGTMLRGLFHVIAPWRDVMAIDKARVTVTPGDVAVIEGDPLQITASVVGQAGSSAAVQNATILFRYPTGQTNSDQMTPAGSGSFSFAVEHVVAPGEYCVTTAQGGSPWYRITLRQRPAVAGIDIKYTYPKYTKLAVKTEHRPDGAIDAVVGTAVQLTIHSNTPLDGKSRLVLSEKGPDAAAEQSIPLSLVNGNDYTANLRPARSGEYRVELIGADGLAGAVGQAHPVTVRPDLPPVISILSPAIKISLPPDDTVPLVFRASDDFGIARVEAIVQLDDQTPDVFTIPPAMRGARELQGTWKLSIPYLLARHTLTDANRIVYQLRATDTRAPDPQSTLTPRQTIEIDHSFKESFAAKKEAVALKDLTEAIKQAIKELGDEGTTIDPLAKAKAGRILTAVQKRGAGQLKDAIVKTGKDLGEVADANSDGPMADIAVAAKEIVTGSIYGGANDLAGALMVADPLPRQKGLVDSAGKIADAKKRLEDLLIKMQKEAKTEELARTLQDLARHEQQVAKSLDQKEAAKNNDRGREVQNQAELRARLDELLAKNPELNSPQAREAAVRNQQLIQKVEQLEQQQSRWNHSRPSSRR